MARKRLVRNLIFHSGVKGGDIRTRIRNRGR